LVSFSSSSIDRPPALLPQPLDLPLEEEGKNNKLEQRNKSENISGQKEKKIKINYCLCVFSLVAGDNDPHRQRRKTEKKKRFLIHRFCCLHRQLRVNPRTASGGGSWSNAPLLFLQVQRAF
jgi:hypothetical protein